MEPVPYGPPTLPPPWATDERLELQSQARDFAADEVLPVADELDHVQGEIPDHLLERMGELGYFGITVDRDHGGLGLGVFEYCMIAEELARAWMSVASIIARAQGMGTGWGDDENRDRLLRESAAGRWIGAASLSEPGAGSDLAGVTTRAVRDGDEWVITGEKRWTGLAKRADFIQMLVRVRDPEEGESRSRGLATIVIPKPRGTLPAGVEATELPKIGYHGFKTWNLRIDGLRVPVENMLGQRRSSEPSGGRSAFSSLEAGLNIARVHTAARAVGLARAALEDCVAYVQEREQFQRPIGDFQAVRFMIAEMAARIDQARSFYRQVAHLVDAGVRCEREAAMVKLVATEMAVEVTGQGIQLHGGNGYTTERQVERHWRDARLTTIFEGTSQIQQKIIADRTLPRSPMG